MMRRRKTIEVKKIDRDKQMIKYRGRKNRPRCLLCKDAGNRITAINKLGDGKRYDSSIDIALGEPDYKID